MINETVVINGDTFDMSIVAHYMDDDIKEELHSDMAPCADQEFVDAYVIKHLEKYGEEYAIN